MSTIPPSPKVASNETPLDDEALLAGEQYNAILESQAIQELADAAGDDAPQTN